MRSLTDSKISTKSKYPGNTESVNKSQNYIEKNE